MNLTLSLRAGIVLVLISLGGMIAETAVAQGPPGGGFRGGDSGRGPGGPGGGFRGPGGDRGGDRGPGGDRGGPGGDRGRGGDDRGSRGGWGGDRGRGGDDRGSRGGDDRGRGGMPSFDPTDMLRRMDRNGNGQLEGDELEGRGGEFVKRMLAGTGMENSSSIKIDAAGEAIQKAREAREKGIESASMSFGESSEVALAVGFDAAPPLSTKALEEKYGKSVVDSTMSMLQRYDKNKNFYLDGTEWKDVRWFGGDPTTFDKDKDGRLSMEELSARTASTRGGSSSTSERGASSDNSRGGDRGGDRGSSRGGDRGGSEERSRGGFGGFGSRGGFGGGPGGGGPGGFGGGPGGPGGSRGGRGGPFGGDGDDEDRYKRIAEMQMRQYDSNGNGFVDGDELEQIRGGNALDYDKNNDRKISLDEMIERMKGFAQRGFGGRGGDRGDRSSRGGDRSSSSETASKPTSYRFLSAAERLPDGLPSWFIRSDADEDGQIMMHEFSTSWSESRVAEFAEYDLNGDGVITAKECLAVEGS